MNFKVDDIIVVSREMENNNPTYAKVVKVDGRGFKVVKLDDVDNVIFFFRKATKSQVAKFIAKKMKT